MTVQLDASLAHQIRKTLRYVAMYGVRRTLAKVQGKYHLASQESFGGSRWDNPAVRGDDAPGRDVAIIGCGNYAFTTIAFFAHRHRPGFLRAACDLDKRRALSLCRVYRGAYATDDPATVLSDPRVRLVFVASNHASHATYAVACIEAGKHVHIEKPHVVSHEQLRALETAMRAHPESKVFLGFNRPNSQLARMLAAYVAEEDGPLMINMSVVGHHLPPGHWYHAAGEGGRVLGNLCHWLDLALSLVGVESAFPCTVIPGTPSDERDDAALMLAFADRSTAAITFSAKGEPFEGVREVVSVQRRNLSALLLDFSRLTINREAMSKSLRLRYRDHGHRATILRSLQGAEPGDALGESVSRVVGSGVLALRAREALESGRAVVADARDLVQ